MKEGNPLGERRMRIGIDGRWYFRGSPSGRVVVRNLAQQLIAHHPEHEYFIFLSRRDRLRPFPFRQANVHTSFLPGPFGLLSICLFLPWKARNLGLDVSLSFYFPPLSGKFRKVVWIDDVIYLEYPEFFTWKEALYFWPIRRLSHLADRICTVSQNEKRRMTRLGFAPQERIAHVPDGVDPCFLPAGGHDPLTIGRVRERFGLPGRFLLYVGRMNVRKNLLHLLEALQRIRDTEIKLVLAGKADWKMFDLAGKIRELGLQDRVMLLGEVADSSLPALYALATVFCYVSFAEGFGLPPLEAMASGVPVVVSDRDALPEVCGEAGTYVDPEKPDEIAAAIDSLLEDPELRERKRAQGLERAGLYSWRHSAEVLLRVFSEAVR